MLFYYLLIKADSKELVGFFSWIANGLGEYHITKMEFDKFNEDLCQKSEYVRKWNDNQITFFFNLSDKEKDDLLKQYNKEEVDAFNKIVN